MGSPSPANRDNTQLAPPLCSRFIHLSLCRHPSLPIRTPYVLIHEKPGERGSWSTHGKEGFYLQPAIAHYRCFHVWCVPTNAPRDTDTLAWLPHDVLMPFATPYDEAAAAIRDLTSALQLLHIDSSQAKEFESLRVLLSESIEPYANTVPKAESLVDNASRLGVNPMTPSPSSPIDTVNHLLDSKGVSTNATHEPATLIFDVNNTSPVLPNVTPRVSGRANKGLNKHRSAASATATTPVNASLNLDAKGAPLKYKSAKAGPNQKFWEGAEAIEINKLLDTQTIDPIHLSQQPLNRRKDTTYYNPQVKEKPGNDGINQDTIFRIRGTIGGDRINYPGKTMARVAAMPVVKVLLNSVVSTVGARFLTADIKDFYLGTPLPRPEYLRIPLKFIPDAVIVERNLAQFKHNGSILFQVNKGMYGLPQAGLLAQDRLINHLATHGYRQMPTPCLFCHDTNGVAFTLVVDDFGIKTCNPAGAEHLFAALREKYEITIDHEGKSYIGFHIEFDYDKGNVELSMPGYVDKMLERFAPTLNAGANSPAQHTPHTFGKHRQVAHVDTTAVLSSADTKFIQEVVGSALYYGRGIDNTILPAVNKIASEQSKPTVSVMNSVIRLLQYLARFRNNILVYTSSDMILHMQSDASFASRSGARSVAGGVFYCGNYNDPTTINGAVHAISSIISVVCDSAAECEYGALYTNAKDAVPIRHTLMHLGHPQKATIILVDNKCAIGLANDTLKAKRTKSIDTRFHWVRDRVRQGQFDVRYCKGSENLADFFTKPLPMHKLRTFQRMLVRIPPAPSDCFQTASSRHANRYQRVS